MNISEILQNGPGYIVLRRDKAFPEIQPKKDVNLLVESLEDWVFYLKCVLRCKGGVCHSYPLTDTHFQLDYYKDGDYIKFDLYQYLISHRFTDDLRKSKRIIDGIFVPSLEMDGISKCYELTYHGKSKYAEYIIYNSELTKYI